MLGDFLLTEELTVDPHVWYDQRNLLLRVEGPRESPGEGNPNGDCLPREELLVDPHVV